MQLISFLLLRTVPIDWHLLVVHIMDDDDSGTTVQGVVVDIGPVKKYSMVTMQDRVFALGSCQNGIPMDGFFATGSSFPVLVVGIFDVFRDTASHCINEIKENLVGHICIVDLKLNQDLRAVFSIAAKEKAQALIVEKWDPTWIASIPVFLVPAETFACLIIYCKTGKVLIQEDCVDPPLDAGVSSPSDVPYDEMKIEPKVMDPFLTGSAHNPVDVTEVTVAHSSEVGGTFSCCTLI